jgi:ectoine hydroxylase-related dioxygenase (phytanoyl-CoA dioxygenase family)
MTSTLARSGRYLRTADCRLADLIALVEQPTDPGDYPYAVEIARKVVVYDAVAIRAALARDDDSRRAVLSELARAFADGPGIAVFRGAFTGDVIDNVSRVFDEIIVDEATTGRAAGDHFARPGANSRVWNALEKVARRDPDAFVDYYANDIIALAATAWLGPNYQVTSAVNVVRPGGQAQEPHRDYHLGFMEDTLAEQYPPHVHALSQVLTLQGAVAHTAMPVESGPTMYLPHSQKYLPGYLAWRRPDFADYFKANFVQLPLAKGDAVFFNPALFHGAGTNYSSGIQRSANLLQVSSAFGRAMEAVDRTSIVRAIYPVLQRRRAEGASDDALRAALAAAAEGYPFPTNLDRDQPVGRLTPVSQAELTWNALMNDQPAAGTMRALDEHAERRITA